MLKSSHQRIVQLTYKLLEKYGIFLVIDELAKLHSNRPYCQAAITCLLWMIFHDDGLTVEHMMYAD